MQKQARVRKLAYAGTTSFYFCQELRELRSFPDTVANIKPRGQWSVSVHPNFILPMTPSEHHFLLTMEAPFSTGDRGTEQELYSLIDSNQLFLVPAASPTENMSYKHTSEK